MASIFVILSSDSGFTVTRTDVAEGVDGYDVTITPLRGFDPPADPVTLYQGSDGSQALSSTGIA